MPNAKLSYSSWLHLMPVQWVGPLGALADTEKLIELDLLH